MPSVYINSLLTPSTINTNLILLFNNAKVCILSAIKSLSHFKSLKMRSSGVKVIVVPTFSTDLTGPTCIILSSLSNDNEHICPSLTDLIVNALDK